MNTHTRYTSPAPAGRSTSKQASSPVPAEAVAAAFAREPLDDFPAAAAEMMVEHLTVPGFMKRVPYRWHLEDITRFGNKVGRAAEALQLSYMTAMDRSLGMIRVFPEPLLRRIYEIMSAEMGWPKIIVADLPEMEEEARKAREEIRANERVAKHLQAIWDATNEEGIRRALSVVLEHMDAEREKLRAQYGIPIEPEAPVAEGATAEGLKRVAYSPTR